MPILVYLLAWSIVPCVWLVIRKHTQLQAGELCDGVVAAHLPKSDGDGTTYALRVTYTDRKARNHALVTGSSTNPPARSVGDAVKVVHYADGRAPDLLVFAHIYIWYWIWFCFALAAGGAMFAPKLMRSLYE
jgi:hypothetical protein